MTHGSLFSGIGGFDLAAEWMGWENVFHCEINQFCQKVLKQHFPGSILYENIKTADFTIHAGGIQVLSGGFPCTQTSIAAAISGNRTGLKGKDSGLWYEYLRVAEQLNSEWVTIENVSGVEFWKDEIQKGLEDIGYTVSILEIKASDCGLPHKRRRVFFIGNANGQRLEIARQTGSPQVDWAERIAIAGGNWVSSASGIIGGFNGLPNRVDRIKALGNAVVPQVVYQIFKAIEQYEITNELKNEI